MMYQVFYNVHLIELPHYTILLGLINTRITRKKTTCFHTNTKFIVVNVHSVQSQNVFRFFKKRRKGSCLPQTSWDILACSYVLNLDAIRK